MKKMKKSFKKVLAQMLVLAMCLTMLPMAKVSVKADGVDAALIDETKKGSITVTKYATVNKKTGVTEAAPLDGTQNPTGTSDDKIDPDDADYPTLAGAKFVLFQIANAEKTKAYYKGDNENTDSYTTATGRFVYNANGTATYDGETVTQFSSEDTEGKTNANGVLEFKNLPVGIYYLKEISANPQITNPLAQDTIISIPMVNTDVSNNDPTAWFYDVYVYPKNHESTGDVELLKQDQNENPLKDVTFKISMKKLGADGKVADASWTEIKKTINDDGSDSAEFNMTTNEEGKITIKNLPANLYGTQYMLEEVSAPAGYTVNPAPIYFKVLPDNTVVFNSTAEDSSEELKNTNSAVINWDNDPEDTAKPVNDNVLELTVRNEKPSIEKAVLKNGVLLADATSTDWVVSEQFRIDDELTYKLTAYVPYNVKEITYKITDTPSVGITDKNEKPVMTVVGETTPVDSNLFTFTYSDSTRGFDLVFDKTQDLTAVAGKTVEIVYKANMNANAEIADSADATAQGNGNTVKLSYSNTVKPDSTENTISDSNLVYTFAYKITKYKDEAAAGKEAEGVEFKLFDDAKEPLYVVGSAGHYRLALTAAEKVATNLTLVTDSKGEIKIDGLENGTYYLRETKTLEGYNLLSEDLTLLVNVTPTTTWHDTVDFSSTNADKVVKSYKETSYANANNSTEGDALTPKTVINKKGFVLPQTGSMGYLLFCVAGILLVFGGAVLMFSGRKKTIR